MPLEIGKRYRIKGRIVDIVESNAAGKQKAAILSDGTRINFGQRGGRIRPGTPAGDQYCARSAGIRSRQDLSANDLARADWHCRGAVSLEDAPEPIE